MRKILLSLFIGIVSCSTEGVLNQIRPNATWIIHAGNYDGIEWADKIQTKPTRQEFQQALADCSTIVSAPTPSLEDRISAIEAHQVDQDAVLSEVATKTGTVFTLQAEPLTP